MIHLKYIIALSILASLFIGCKNKDTQQPIKETTGNKEKVTSLEIKSIPQIKPQFTTLDKNVSQHISDLFKTYLDIKTALVNSNSTEAKTGASAMVNVIEDFDRSFLPAEYKNVYVRSVTAIKNAALAIAHDEDPEKQRISFSTLPGNAYELIKTFGTGSTIYHQHCSMAFENNGAMWLSEKKEIANPYYGEKMLTCGSVEEIIEK